MIRINSVYHDGKAGQFRANTEMIGWRDNEGETTVCHAVGNVKKAEWLEGKLRILCELEATEGTAACQDVFALEGFQAADFDKLWHHFESCCGVYIRKHRRKSKASEAHFDAAMHAIEEAADMLDEMESGSVQKKAREADLMKQIEGVCNGLEEAVRGDKQELNRVFSANCCERIGRLRYVIDNVQLEVYKNDQRWLSLRDKVKTVECVLRELGTFRVWRPPEDVQDVSTLKQHIEPDLRLGPGAEAAVLQDPLRSGPTKTNPVGTPITAMQSALEPLKGSLVSTAIEDDSILVSTVPFPSQQEERAIRSFDLISMQLGLNDTRTDSIFEGWVWKQSRYLKRWRRRYMVLTNHRLETLKTCGGLKPTESIQAGSVQRVYSLDGEMQRSGGFCVVSAGRNFLMVCDDSRQKAEWVRLIAQTLCALAEPVGSGAAGDVSHPGPFATQKSVFGALPFLGNLSLSAAISPWAAARRHDEHDAAEILVGVDRMHYTRADSVFEGWVWKQSRYLKRWRRRWLILTRNGLLSLKDVGGVKPTEKIDASVVQSVYSADEEVQRAACFCIASSRRNFFIVCDDEAQKAQWIRLVSQTFGAGQGLSNFAIAPRW